MRYKKTSAEAGFTLIELLLAGTIMALMLGAAVLALSQVLSSIEHSREYLERLRVSQLIFSRLQREIGSAFCPLAEDAILFSGKNQGDGERAEDTLEFQTKIDALSHLASSGLYQVKYQLRDAEAGEGKQLIWSAVPVLGTETGESREIILGAGVKALNFQYYFDKDWADSFEAESYGFLPQAVKITLVLVGKKEPLWQELVVAIPVGGRKPE